MKLLACYCIVSVGLNLCMVLELGGTRKDTCRYLLNTVFEFQGTGHLTLAQTYSPLIANTLKVAECLIISLDSVAKVWFF